MVRLERGRRKLRRDEQVVVAVQEVHAPAERLALPLDGAVLERRDAEARLREFEERRIEQRALLWAHRIDPDREGDRPQRLHDLDRVVEREIDLVDVRAEAGEHRDRAIDARRDFRIDLRVAERAAVRDAHAGDARVEAVAIVDAERRTRVEVARLGAGDHGHHQRRIVHRAGDRPLMPERQGRRMRMHRHDAERGLESEEPAEPRGDADRSAAVGRDVHRAHAERGCDRRTAAAATGRHPGVPRIHGEAAERTVGDALPAELRRRRLAEEHGALLAHAGDGCAVFVPRLVGVHGQRTAPRRPALAEQEILHGRREAVDEAQRTTTLPARLGGCGRSQRGFRIDHDECVVDGLQVRDAIERRLRDFDRRELARTIVFDQRRGRQREDVVGHGDAAWQLGEETGTGGGCDAAPGPAALFGEHPHDRIREDTVRADYPARRHRFRGAGRP